jgi:NAD(P)-dependent dehydrogenase (short-subunit alcohol dehydrogenase family)
MAAHEGLAGKVALVTGGGSGIGAACARMLASRGASVLVADRNFARATEVAREIGDHASAAEADVASLQDCLSMVGSAMQAFGRLDIAINNAGIGNPNHAKLADIAEEDWRRLIGINLDGVYLSMKAEIPAMLQAGGGSIVNMASVMAMVATPGAAAYIAAKHGVVGLTKAAALDYAQSGIRINAVGPAYVDTPLLANRTQEQRAELVARHPVGRLASAEDVAELVCFLAAPAAGFLTGAYYPVDGGYLAR